MKKSVYETEKSWRNHQIDKVGFPNSKDALNGLNDLVGWCVGQGMKTGKMNSFMLCMRMWKHIRKLESIKK